MEAHTRELLVARICSGTVRLKLMRRDGVRTYLVCRPSRAQLYLAQEVHAEQLYAAGLAGLFDDDELHVHLLENELWDSERQTLLEKLPEEIEEFKVQLFKAGFRTNERKVLRRALATARGKLGQLHSERHSLDHLSVSGTAALARTRFLLGCSLSHESGERVFTELTFWEEPSDLLDAALAELSRQRMDEPVYRELARTEPWRSIWQCQKTERSLFGTPASDCTEEQRTLVSFSSLYDSVYEHPDCPPDDVVADDDLLDGWLIDQRRQRLGRQNKASGEELIGNEKIRSSQEVYLVADTTADAKKVMDMNEPHARAVQKQRFAHLRQKGELNELEMPDTRQRLRMEATQKFTEGMKARR